jgi:hypothetical protein
MLLKLIAAAVALAALAFGTVATRAPAPAAEPGTTTAVAGPPPTPASGEVALEFTEAELTDQLNQRLVGKPLADTPLGAATLTRIATQLRTNEFVTSGDATVGGSNVPISATGHIDVESGRPVVSVTQATAGGVPLPSRARDAMRQAVQDQIDAEVNRQGLHVKSVNISNGRLRLIGATTAEVR